LQKKSLFRIKKVIQKFQFSLKVDCVYMHVKGFQNLKFLSFLFIFLDVVLHREGGLDLDMREKMDIYPLVQVGISNRD
jgi:hypothetical protein